MTTRLWRIGALTLLLIGCGAALGWLQRDNARLRRQVAAARGQQEQIARLRAENARTRSLQSSDTNSAALHAEIARLAAAIADRETGGRRVAPAAVAVDRRRDPEKELTPIESFRDVGRGTPRAAMQTLMAAALRGNDAQAAPLIAFDDGARAEVEAWLARMSPELRGKFPTPESLALLLFADVVTRHETAQLKREDFSDLRTATVTVAFARAPAGMPLPMKLSANGWQLVVSAELLPELRRALAAKADVKP
jgi:hypothetical protein